MSSFNSVLRGLLLLGIAGCTQTGSPTGSKQQALGTAALNVFVGYADSLRPGANFPTPWQGAPNTVFFGNNPAGYYDAGAIRLDNTSNLPVTIDSVNVDLQRPGPTFNLWGSFIIPAGSSAILTATTNDNFDTSDYVISSCGNPVGPNDPRIPKVTVTILGMATDFLDTGHVLDTGGFDLACQGNESLAWRAIGTTGVGNASDTITLAPLTSTQRVNTAYTATATVLDPSGMPAANVTVTFDVTAGPNTGLTGTAVTDAGGNATFTYSSGVVGTDTLAATIHNASGGSIGSNPVATTWTPNIPPKAICDSVSVSADATCSGCVNVTVCSGTDPQGLPLVCVFSTGSIVSTAGAAVKVPPPPSLLPGVGFQSTTEMIVFDEKQDVTLTAPLVVDAVAPGTYTFPGPGPSTINAGTQVRSHLFQTSSPQGAVLDGSATFDSDVIGLIFDDATLDLSDYLGAPGTVYQTGIAARGAETTELITLSADRRTVTFHSAFSLPGDEVRVITIATHCFTGAGPHTFTCTCTSSTGQTDSCMGTVTVVDVTPPTITCPGNETLECTNGGAVASFTATATDNCGNPTVACVPPSGSTFPLTPPGPTCASDTCTATDAAGNPASCSFNVCVQATVPPVVVTRTGVCLPEPKGADPTKADKDDKDDKDDKGKNDDDDKGKNEGKKTDTRTISLADCVASVTSQCFGSLDINTVGVITRVEKVGFEDRGEHQCHPKNYSINGSSVTLGGADENGTFDLFFTVTDASGNTVTGSCEVKLVERPKDCQPKKHKDDDDDKGDKDGKKHKVDPDAAQDQPTCVCCVGTGCGTCPAEDNDKDEHKHHGGDDKDHGGDDKDHHRH